MQNSGRVQEFLRFKRQNPDWLSQVKKQRREEEQEQKQISKLVNRNHLKKKELESIRKEYEKVKRSTQQMLDSMGSEENALDQEIQTLEKKKMDHFRKTVMVEQKIEHLREEVETLKSEISNKQSSDKEILRNLHNDIAKYKKMVEDVSERVAIHEEWLSHKQSNRSSFQTINIPEIQSDLQSIKKSNESLMKEITAEQKRLKKETEEIKRGYRDYCQKTDDRIKAWIKKGDSVIDQKKDVKILLEGIDENTPLEQMGEIELLYKTELTSLSSLYEAESQKQLGDFFIPYSIKMQGTGIQKQGERNNNQSNESEEKKLNEMNEELLVTKDELIECDNCIESLKIRIDKYGKDIEAIKQSIAYKKKH